MDKYKKINSSIETYNANLFDKLDDLDDNSIHAVVTDPPYGLGFMGESWDEFDSKEYQEFTERWSKEVKRVLKPGGYLLAFSGSRTHHRMFCGLEDAGYTIRDTLTWHYGEGFPKGQDLQDSIDRWADVDSNKDWSGFSTQLKPATEFVSLARKPLSEDSNYANVLEHAVGGLNIDRCRIDLEDDEDNPTGSDGTGSRQAEENYGYTGKDSGKNVTPDSGRYPSNLLLSDVGKILLDKYTEKTEQNVKETKHTDDSNGYFGSDDGEYTTDMYPDSGGKSRYFKQFEEPTELSFKYNTKASKSERTHNGEVDNDHPTVKPIELMGWLIRLVTRENQKVLDPFMGSGTTALASVKEGRNFVGIEKEDEYYEISSKRIENVDELLDKQD